MAKKQNTVSTSVAGAAPALSAKPRAPRVKSATHTKAVTAEPPVATDNRVIAPDAQLDPVAVDPRETIAKIAYGYWEARGYQGGNALEDWVRAEQEYSRSVA
jgi:hypothetical protein